MEEAEVRRIVGEMIREERQRIVQSIRAIEVPTEGSECGFFPRREFEEFRDSVVEAIEG
jgi:hypothetical protein